MSSNGDEPGGCANFKKYLPNPNICAKLKSEQMFTCGYEENVKSLADFASAWLIVCRNK